VASFGHLSGVHYQNKTHWDDYLADVEAGRLPVQRGLAASPRERLIRELVLSLKRGSIDPSRLLAKFGVDPVAEWGTVWNELAAQGFLEPLAGDGVPRLTRRGLLQVDSLLPRFFEQESTV